MKSAIDLLYDAKDIIENIEAEYEIDPIRLQSILQETIEAIDKAICIIHGD